MAGGIAWIVLAAVSGLAQTDPAVHLTNVAETAGLRFVYQHSPTPEKYFVESVPGGVAVFDYNGDGRPDIFSTNGARTPSLEKVSPIYSNRLYRNDDRPAGRHEDQSRRDRRTGHRRQPGAHDDHGDGLCELVTCWTAFRVGQ